MQAASVWEMRVVGKAEDWHCWALPPVRPRHDSARCDAPLVDCVLARNVCELQAQQARVPMVWPCATRRQDAAYVARMGVPRCALVWACSEAEEGAEQWLKAISWWSDIEMR